MLYRAIILAVAQCAAVDIHDEGADKLSAVAREFHHARLVDAKVTDHTTLLQLLEEGVIRLPILQRVALAIECTFEGYDCWELTRLLHIDIAFEADHTLVVGPLRDVGTTIHRLRKGYKLLGVANATCVDGNNR